LNESIISELVEIEQPGIKGNIIRELTPELSIRKGKYGAYVYYKTDKMKKPEFFNIQKCRGYTTNDIGTILAWLKKTYPELSIESIPDKN
jgi:hypothetical protein